jgi:hypothetical protein
MRKLNLLLPIALMAPLVSSCVAAAVGVGAGAVIGTEVLDNDTYVARIDMSSARLWPTAKTTLSHMSMKPIDVNDALKTAVAEIDQAKVTVVVETYDIEQSVLRVNARKYGIANGDISKMVLDNILSDLEK